MRHRLLTVGIYAVVALVGLALLRREVRWWMGRDTAPCPTCMVLAFDRGEVLVDEMGHRLRFATPDLAARYAEEYARP